MASIADGDKLMDEGEKKLTKFALFTSKEEKQEKAREKFLKAGTIYKACAAYDRAASAYMRAADMSQLLKSDLDFVGDCEEAAKMLKKANDPRATEMFTKVVDMFDQQQKYSQAAKYCMAIAEQCKGREATEWMNRAARYHHSVGSKVTAGECVTKVAELQAASGEYSEAQRLYEKQAQDALDDRLSRGGARKLFFQALLCIIADINGANLIESIEHLRHKFEEYQDLDNQFNEHTREHMLIRDVIDALEDQNLEKYEEAVAEYDNIVPLDDKKMKMLLRGKQVLRGGGDLR